MGKIFLLIVFNLLIYSFATAQYFPAMRKVQEVKILESNRDEVRKILADYKLKSYTIEDLFTKNGVSITVRYSRGKCLIADNSIDLNIAQGKVIEVDISFKKQIELNKVQPDLQKLGIDISNFVKEKIYPEDSNHFVYHNKELGIGLETAYNKVDNIFLMPARKHYSLMCDKERAEILSSTESIFGLPPEDRLKVYGVSPYADVIKLDLSKMEIIKNCSQEGFNANNNCLEKSAIVAVSAAATNPGKDFVEYVYRITGGKIIGTGRKVLWDLSNVKAGTYEIMVGADDGCGICGAVQRKTVTVK